MAARRVRLWWLGSRGLSEVEVVLYLGYVEGFWSSAGCSAGPGWSRKWSSGLVRNGVGEVLESSVRSSKMGLEVVFQWSWEWSSSVSE